MEIHIYSYCEMARRFAKIFEYLAARRPILATGGSSDVITGLLNETKAGIDAPTIPDIKDALEKLYHESVEG